MDNEPSPVTPAAIYTQGRRLLDEGNTAEAIPALEKAVALQPDNAGWRAGLGSAYLKAGQPEKALGAFQDAMRLRPGERRFALSCANTLLKLDRGAEAKAIFAAVTAEDPSLVAAWTGLGRAAALLGDAAAARAAHERILDLDPQNAASHEALARIAEAGDDRDTALRHRDAVAGLRPDHAPSHLALARLLMMAGRFSQAGDAYRRVLDIQPDHPSARAILDELQGWDRNGHPASKEASVQYYDAIYAGENAYGRDGTDLDESRHFSLICDVLAGSGAGAVLDIGCGPGQFAQYLRSRLSIPYAGLDFSPVAIECARKRNIADARFAVCDITRDPLPPLDPGTAIVCTEVLEHIAADLDVIARFPAGHHCCCSVPNFYTFSHVRHFSDRAQVERRYGPFFDDLSITEIPLGRGSNRLFVFCGKRNAAQPGPDLTA